MNRGDAEYAEKYNNRNQRVKTEFNSRPISFDFLRVLRASAVTAFQTMNCGDAEYAEKYNNRNQ
jgi:hypothetical protein